MKSFLASVSLMLCVALTSAADFDWKTRFPEGLIDANGKAVDLTTLKNKTVAVYCSAHWCPPCRIFTPQLVRFANANKTKLAVVFISSDKDESQMLAYMKETKMPWPAVPFRSAGGRGDSEGTGRVRHPDAPCIREKWRASHQERARFGRPQEVAR